jgi:hypothetical protein
MPTTVTIADDLAIQLRPYQAQLPQILALGIREWQAREDAGYSGISGVLETLAGLPTPEEVLALRPTPQLQERIDSLLEKNRSTGLSPEDKREWEKYEYVEHLVRLAKTSALRKLKASDIPLN